MGIVKRWSYKASSCLGSAALAMSVRCSVKSFRDEADQHEDGMDIVDAHTEAFAPRILFKIPPIVLYEQDRKQHAMRGSRLRIAFLLLRLVLLKNEMVSRQHMSYSEKRTTLASLHSANSNQELSC